MNCAYQVLNGALNQLRKSIGAAERMLTVLEVKTDLVPTRGSETATAGVESRMLDCICFHYQTRRGRIVLISISGEFPHSSVTAIVGGSGGGKSTTMLCMYGPQVMCVLFHGQDIRDPLLKRLHHQCAVVAQDMQVFSCSVEDNVSHGLEKGSHEAAVTAAKAVNAHSFIVGLLDGYSAFVGERGGRRSGGQRQRIAIAHAPLRKQRVLNEFIASLHESCTIIVIG